MTVVFAEGVDQFLENVSTSFKLYVCSLGQIEYVRAVVRHLNRNKEYITQDAIFSEWDEYMRRRAKVQDGIKNLDKILPQFSSESILVVDDNVNVWRKDHRSNVIPIPRVRAILLQFCSC
jgi:TFIIF-interacting CTD phosphatase-like protein